MPKVFQCVKCKKAIFGSIYSLVEHNEKCNINDQVTDTTFTQKASVPPAMRSNENFQRQPTSIATNT